MATTKTSSGTPLEHEAIDFAAVRERLAGVRGREYWRSLEELAETRAFQDLLHREFPQHAATFADAVGRREFLRLAAASLALAGVSGCTSQPPEKIVPYVRHPEGIIPGKPLFFATATSLAGVATGVLVESHLGRPTKVEGNPDHAGSLGATDVFSQASVLSLYDPDRSQTLTYLGEIRPWSTFIGAVRSALEAKKQNGGAGLRILTETVTSPTLAAQLRQLLTTFPAARWHQWEPAGRHHAQAGARLAFGEPVETQYRFAAADVIVALDADFLSCWPGSLRYIRDFSARRRPPQATDSMNRLYVVESTFSNTGAMADHRWPLRPSQVEQFARRLAAAVGVTNYRSSDDSPLSAEAEHAIAAIAKDLAEHRGASVVLAGEHQPPVIHALVHAMNHTLGNIGRTTIHTASIEAEPVDQVASLRELVNDMEASKVDLLVILSGNPVYTAPADLQFAERLSKTALRIHLGLHDDETSALCHWHVPEAHSLEAWSDARAYDGTVTIGQPLIAPLYGGKSAHEVLTVFTDRPELSGHDIVREYWARWFGGRRGADLGRSADSRGTGTTAPSASTPVPTQQLGGPEFDRFWRQALHDGVVAGTSLPEKQVALTTSTPSTERASAPRTDPKPLEIVFRPDPTLFDGRFANNGWLQELPKPLTKLTWDNAALLSPATAARLGLSVAIAFQGGEHGQVLADVVELRYRGRSVRAPIWILPGHADDCVTVHLGYGRTRAGHVGTGTGFDAYQLRTSDAPWAGDGVEVRKTGERYPLAGTQSHHSMEGREFVRVGTLDEFRANPAFAHERHEEPPRTLTMYPEFSYEGYAWGMAIDVNACVGCNACVVACQAENNIPIVGKEQVLRGREMHWLRIDRYFEGSVDNPQAFHQPVPCMHCENAPCEVVCPVAATVHSAEGLNDMVYNRCVGTRYCSNNCPYKVRRFNFLLYQDWTTPSLKLGRNPDVTVRSRGVMEKCTYCVQRITAAKITAEKEDRSVRDGEILTACQAVCPAEAIVFGNINDPNSRVSRLKAEPRNYGLLAELNTRPRTTYLAAVKNPNPAIPSSQPSHTGQGGPHHG